MVVLVAESLLERGGLDLPDILARFQRWAASEPKGIGLQTEDALTNGMPWDLAAAVHFAAAGQEATMDAARRITALPHGDRAAWEGTAIVHELIRVTFEDTDPLTAPPDILAVVHRDHRDRYATVLAPDWHPDQATEFNGAVWPCLGSAVWACAPPPVPKTRYARRSTSAVTRTPSPR